MTTISSPHPTTERLGEEHLRMATHRIPTDEISPTPRAAGMASNHRILAVPSTAPSDDNDDTMCLPNPTRASHQYTLYPPLHLTGRGRAQADTIARSEGRTSIIPAPRNLKLPSMLEGICPSLGRPTTRDGFSYPTPLHHHESKHITREPLILPQSTGLALLPTALALT